MNKIINNLMVINKMIIFCENILKDDIDEAYFTDKLEYDINYINNLISALYQEYLKHILEYKEENILKTYSATLHRFNKFLKKIDGNDALIKRFSINLSIFNSIVRDVTARIELLKEHEERKKLAQSQGQYINEEEYNMLFEDLSM